MDRQAKKLVHSRDESDDDGSDSDMEKDTVRLQKDQLLYSNCKVCPFTNYYLSS